MSEDNQRAWIETYLSGLVLAQQPDVTLKFPNTKGNKPDTPYLEYFVLGGDAKQAELVEGGFERHVGVLQVDVMVAEDSGTGIATRLADWVVKQFSRKSQELAGGERLRFRVGRHVDRGVKDGLYIRSCSIPYWRDERQAT